MVRRSVRHSLPSPSAIIVGHHIITLRTRLSQFTMPPTQTTRTNHLGYDVGASRKIPDGALARVATAECLEANNPTHSRGLLSRSSASSASASAW